MSLPAWVWVCVVSVCVCARVNPELVRAIIQNHFKLGLPEVRGTKHLG